MSYPLVRIEECARIVSGATPSTTKPDFWNGRIMWATPADLSKLDGPFISETPRTITEAGLESCAAEVLPPHSVLFSSRAPIGHVAINTAPMATNQGFKSFIPNPTRLDAQYLYFWLRAHRPYLESLGNGATFKEVSKAVVSRIEIPLPPLDEQRRIAAILDQADDLRRKRREALGRLSLLSQSCFEEQFGDPMSNTKGFPQAILENLIDPSRPVTYGILMPGPDIEDGVPYIRVVDIQNGSIQLGGIRKTTREIAEQYKRSTISSGDLLLSIRGHVGRMAIVPDQLTGANITQDTARLAFLGADTIYVKSLLETKQAKNWMDQRTKGAAVRGLNLGDLRKMPIALPPLPLQRAFAARVAEIDKLKAHHRAHLARLDALFASLQHRAFRGDLAALSFSRSREKVASRSEVG